MRIGGFHKFSLIDYPGKIAAVIFTQGCNFRCRYCYNPELVFPGKFQDPVKECDVFYYLQKRRQYLEGVVVTGGEPTFQPDLIPFLEKLKQLGYLIKLDTNGSRPDVVAQIIQLKLADYIAMDVKAPLCKYAQTIGVDFPVDKIKQSIDLIMHSGIQYEFRTTVVKELCSYDDMANIAALLEKTRAHTIQEFRPNDKILDPNLLTKEQYSDREFKAIKLKWEKGLPVKIVQKI